MKINFSQKHFKQILLATMALIMLGCSTQKDAAINKLYHKINTKYNGLFYAKYHLEEGIKKLENKHIDNYENIISINRLGSFLDAKSVQSSFDKAIQKSQLAIKKHSMDIGGVEKNKLIDEAYLIMAKAQFYKQDYFVAQNTFSYLLKKSLKENIQAEAALWLAACHQELGNFETLKQNIRKLKDDLYLTLEQEGRLFEIEAELAISENDLEEARIQLLKSLESNKNNYKKARINFILGQISLEQKNDKNAIKHFQQVIKKNPNYELVFKSKLNQTKATNLTNRGFEKIKTELQKMLKDKKNNEYKDQIYFALANLDLKNTDTTTAKTHLSLSAALASLNIPQKIKSHQKLANIFWDQKNYLEAFVHNDSAYQLIDSKHKDYDQIRSMHKNTKKLAELYKTINFNDSIIELAQSPEDLRNQIIDEYIEKLKKQDAEKLNQQQNNKQSSNYNSYEFNRQAQNSMNVAAGGGWYFYNPSAISLGYSEFIARWGNRKLEDNWRRKNKNQVNNEEDFSLSESSEPSQKEKYDRSYYIAQLPLEEAQQLQLFSQIETAHYDLGVLFKDEVVDYYQAVNIYGELLNRFPETNYKQIVYFDLCNLYKTLKDTVTSNIYVTKIQNEFPGSTYLSILNGTSSDTTQIQKDESVYAQAYALYSNFTNTSCEELNQIVKQNSQSIFFAQMDLLNAFCKAKSLDKKQFILLLENLRDKHSKSDILIEINNIISTLRGGGGEFINESRYVDTFQSPHIFLLLLNSLSVNLPEMQSKLSTFNNQNYSIDKLEITNLLLDKSNQLIRVAKFKDKENALAYFQLIQESTDIKQIIESKEVFPLVISEDNFKKLLRHKDIKEYIDYFNAIYLLN